MNGAVQPQTLRVITLRPLSVRTGSRTRCCLWTWLRTTYWWTGGSDGPTVPGATSTGSN